MAAPGTPPQGPPPGTPQGQPQAPQAPGTPPPTWTTEPARRVTAPGTGSWRRAVSVIGIVLVVLAVLLAAAMLVGALRQLAGTTLHPTSAALPSAVSNLTVVADHGDLILREGEDHVVRTTGPAASFNESRIEVEDLGGGDTEVTISGPQRWFPAPIGPRSASAFEVVVPAGTLDEVTLRTQLGDITAEGVVADRALTAHSALGSISLTGGTEEQIDATAEAGDVTVDLPDAAPLPHRITASSELGDVDVTVPRAPADHWYRVESASDLGTAHDGTRTRTPVPGGQETLIVAETATGTVRVTER